MECKHCHPTEPNNNLLYEEHSLLIEHRYRYSVNVLNIQSFDWDQLNRPLSMPTNQISLGISCGVLFRYVYF